MSSLRWFLALSVVFFVVSGCGKKEPVKPNVIIISIDTLRADHLGCYGYPRPISPAIDKIASQGLLFEDVSTTSPWTLPAHASLLTGLYPSRHGVKSENSKISVDITTLASVLAQNGFATGAVVNSEYLGREYGFAQGFDFYSRLPEIHNALGVATAITAQAVDWLAENKNERFFLFLHYYDVHSDYSSLRRYETQFVGPYSGLVDGSTSQLLRFRKGQFDLNKADVKHLSDLYAAGVRQMDDDLKKLFAFLKKQKLLDKTLLIITSDHGEEFLDHGGVLHGRTQFQELIHVPLIIRAPGIPRDKRINYPASLVDVMPTVLTMLDIPAPSSIDGIDLSSLWQKGGTQPPTTFIFAEADHYNIKHDIKRAIRHQQYKLHYDLLTKETQLYDLANDPKEKVNIISEHNPMAESLLKRLKKFMQSEKTAPKRTPLSPQEIEKLKSLGYLQ